MGAWIEICRWQDICKEKHLVAPLMGAWIEIDKVYTLVSVISVAPLMGAWIEIIEINATENGAPGRAPHGRVD